MKEKNKNYYAVIMAGGVGSRFWPVSTTAFPKQFHDMLGTGKSLLQQTFDRLHHIIPAQNIFILTNERYQSITLEQLPQITSGQVILEPAMRNTAPCILLAALKIQKQNPDALMLVAPSDHWIEDEKSFHSDVKQCFDVAQQQDVLMTLGITPTFANTGYGYIEAASKKEAISSVIQFREKPDYETAKAFVASGNFLWNAGIFLWSVASITKAFAQYAPLMSDLFAKGVSVYNTKEEKTFIQENYPLAENISIDFGIMEKATNVQVKKATFDWNDLGTWGALHDKMTSKPEENAIVNAQVLLEEASGNMVFSASKKIIIIDGLKDYIVVDKENVLLVYPKSKEQDIKKLVAKVTTTFGEKYK